MALHLYIDDEFLCTTVGLGRIRFDDHYCRSKFRTVDIIDFGGYCPPRLGRKAVLLYPLLRRSFPKKKLRVVVRVLRRGAAWLALVDPIKYLMGIGNDAFVDELRRCVFRCEFSGYLVDRINVTPIPKTTERGL